MQEKIYSQLEPHFKQNPIAKITIVGLVWSAMLYIIIELFFTFTGIGYLYAVSLSILIGFGYSVIIMLPKVKSFRKVVEKEEEYLTQLYSGIDYLIPTIKITNGRFYLQDALVIKDDKLFLILMKTNIEANSTVFDTKDYNILMDDSFSFQINKEDPRLISISVTVDEKEYIFHIMNIDEVYQYINNLTTKQEVL